jgi:hypothetical protein
MRVLIAAGLCVVLAVVAFNRIAGPSIDPETPVVVYSADPLKVILPADPDTNDITGYVYAELVAAAKRESGVLSEDLRTMSEDQELLGWIAASGERRFTSNEAAALAYPLYGVTVESEVVFITTTTVELLPQHWAIGYSIGHEDGHAIINRMIAESCGSALVRTNADGRLRGRGLEVAIQNGLLELGDAAHNRYHEMVNGVRSAAFARSARTAAEEVITARC